MSCLRFPQQRLIKPNNRGSLITMSSCSWPLKPFRGDGEGAGVYSSCTGWRQGAPLNETPVPPRALSQHFRVQHFAQKYLGSVGEENYCVFIYLQGSASAFHTPETEAAILVCFSQSQSCKNAVDNPTLASGDHDWCVCACVERAWMCDCSWFAHTCHCSANLDSHSEGVSVK